MEAALRTVYEVVTRKELPDKLHVAPIVGLEQVRQPPSELRIRFLHMNI